MLLVYLSDSYQRYVYPKYLYILLYIHSELSIKRQVMLNGTMNKARIIFGIGMLFCKIALCSINSLSYWPPKAFLNIKFL
jgi:hypothetical protein